MTRKLPSTKSTEIISKLELIFKSLLCDSILNKHVHDGKNKRLITPEIMKPKKATLDELEMMEVCLTTKETNK